MMKPVRYETGTDIYNQNDKKVGTIDRLVIDPRTKQITHIVIRKSFLFSQDKVIPTSLIEADANQKPKLRGEVTDLDALPDFEEVHYVLAEPEQAATDDRDRIYWYAPMIHGAGLAYPPFYGDSPSIQMDVREQNIPEDTIALEKNADVYSRDGELIGNIDSIYTNRDTNQATYFLIKKGIFLTEDKLVPAWWVDVADENEVRLAVNSTIFEQLPAFEPES